MDDSVFYDTSKTSPAMEARMAKYGHSVNLHLVEEICEQIEDYPEIIEAVERYQTGVE